MTVDRPQQPAPSQGTAAETPSALPAVHEAWLPKEHSLHRPRHGGRQLTALVCALLFFAVPSVSWVFGARPGTIENRALAPFPSLAGGFDAFTALSRWATDHLVFRGGGVQAANGISHWLFGEPYPFGADPNGQQTGPLPGSTPPNNQPSAVGPQVGPQTSNGSPLVIEGQHGWLYLSQDASAKCAPSQPLNATVGQLRQLRSVVEASGRQFVFVVAPDKSTIEPQNLPGTFADKACAASAGPVFWQQMTDEIGAVDLRSALLERQGQLPYPIYDQLDSHWTEEGALVMTRAIAEALQPGITRTWHSDLTESITVTADLPPLIGESGTKKYNSYSLVPFGFADRARPLRDPTMSAPQHVTSAPEAGTYSAPVTVLGDSFTQGAAQYLSAAFNDLTVVPYEKIPDLARAGSSLFVNSKVIVIESVERTVAQGNGQYLDPGFIKQLGQLLAAHPMR